MDKLRCKYLRVKKNDEKKNYEKNSGQEPIVLRKIRH